MPLASPRPAHLGLRASAVALAAALAAAPGCNRSSSAAEMAGGDASVLGDLSAAAPDLAIAPDLAPAPDLATPLDLKVAPDLTQPGNNCMMHDPAKGTCMDLGNWIIEWVQCHTACSTGVDCTVVDTHYGSFCRNPCPTVVGTGTSGAYLDSLDAAFVNMGCGMAGCACKMPGVPSCDKGNCVGK